MFRDSWPKSHPLEPRTPRLPYYVSTPPPPGVQSFKTASAVCQRLDTSVNQLKNELKSPINVRVRFSDGIVKQQSVTGALDRA